MDGIHLEWTSDETLFAVVAMLIVAISTFGIDRLLFRSKSRPIRPPDPRNYRVGYIVEEKDETSEENDHEDRK